MQLLSKALIVAGVVLSSLTAVLAFNNPIVYQDLPDVDLRRVNNTYYLSTSTFHFSPGAPIHRSYDLVNWEPIGHSVPQLAPYFGEGYAMPPVGKSAYIEGIWASWLLFVPSKQKWFWGGCTNFYQTHIFSSSGSDPTTGWTQIAVLNQCQYDSGAMVDDDGTVYISFKDGGKVWMSQMAPDLKSTVKTQVILTPAADMTSIEGSRPYKRNGKYYVFLSFPDKGNEYVLRSNTVFGNYELRDFIPQGTLFPTGFSGTIGQGALVDTPNDKWYWMGFSWSYPGGRIPFLLPVTWSSDGWPVPTLVNGRVGSSYPDPLPLRPLAPWTGLDTFRGAALGSQWEWNHDPDTTRFTVNNGLTLSTASVTPDWYAARNTLTRRVLGPISTATIKLSYGTMASGDRAGLGLLRDQSSYIGVWKAANGAYTVNMVQGLAQDQKDPANDWATLSVGTVAASAPISGGTLWLRVINDATPTSNSGSFYYSQDGKTFVRLGPSTTVNTDWHFFMGMRFAILNFATTAFGGKVNVASFDLAAGLYTGPARI